ncbi:MAG: putative DNA-3-methyladenine glycosylase, partial [Actinomycetia bacterium]|nr:putative DNA-3-methyladenine glycosylase [Actinomycetes bacterium]
ARYIPDERHRRQTAAVGRTAVRTQSRADTRASGMTFRGRAKSGDATRASLVAATRRTIVRIEALFDGHLPSPAELLAVDPIQLRAAGLSWRKIGTLRDLAERLSDGRLDEDALPELSDDDFISALTAIPGIGPWTAQGVLLVALRREDVVLPGDLALRKAIRNAYKLDQLPSEQEVLAIAEKWRPFRSLATSYLFASAFDSNKAEA